MESWSEDEYDEPSSEEEGENAAVKNDGLVNDNAPVDYGFDDEFIGDSNFTRYSCRGIYILKKCKAFVLERRICVGFLVPELPIPERLNFVLSAVNVVSWQRAVLSGSGEVIIDKLPAVSTGFSFTTPRDT